MNFAKLIFLIFSCLGLSLAQEFIPRCGDCWCISGSGVSCPEYPEGISDDTIPEEDVDSYSTFKLTSTPITLTDADGNANCWPFADAVGSPIENYPESQFPQCQKPESTVGVCAILYAAAADDPDVCPDRSYEMDSYASAEDAEAAGAVVTHSGPCGVCSNLLDFAMRMKGAADFEQTSLLCSVSYSIGKDFDGLSACYQEKLGLSSECSTLWAHYSATNFFLCAAECAEGISGTFDLNGEPPECELSACLQCSNDTFQADFDILSGRTLQGSGITQRLARPCEDIYPVIHDPCEGGLTNGTSPPSTTPPVTEAPASGGSASRVPLIAALLAFVVAR